jgi:hypothetical protein
MKYAVNCATTCICHFAFSAKYVLRRIQSDLFAVYRSILIHLLLANKPDYILLRISANPI